MSALVTADATVDGGGDALATANAAVCVGGDRRTEVTEIGDKRDGDE